MWQRLKLCNRFQGYPTCDREWSCAIDFRGIRHVICENTLTFQKIFSLKFLVLSIPLSVFECKQVWESLFPDYIKCLGRERVKGICLCTPINDVQTSSQNTGVICLCTSINDVQTPNQLSKYRSDLSVYPYQWCADTQQALKIQEWSVCVPLSVMCRHPTSSQNTGVICLCTPITDVQTPHQLSKYRSDLCTPINEVQTPHQLSKYRSDLSVYPYQWCADNPPALKIQERSVCVCNHRVQLRSRVFMSSPLYPALNTVTRVSLECCHGLTKVLYGDQCRASCLPTGRERRRCREGWGTHCFWSWPPEKTSRCTSSCAHNKRWCASCNRESFETGENLTLSLPKHFM